MGLTDRSRDYATREGAKLDATRNPVQNTTRDDRQIVYLRQYIAHLEREENACLRVRDMEGYSEHHALKLQAETELYSLLDG